MLDPTTGRPASVPDAPERAHRCTRGGERRAQRRAVGPAASGARRAGCAQRPKIGDTRPAPPLPKPPSPSGPAGNGRKGTASSSESAQRRAKPAGGAAAGSTGHRGRRLARRRRGGRGRSAAAARQPLAPGGESAGGADGAGPGGRLEGRRRRRAPEQRRAATVAGAAAVPEPASGRRCTLAQGPRRDRCVTPTRCNGRAETGVAGRSAATSCACTSSMSDPHRGARRPGAHRALRRPAAGRRQPDRRQHLPRAGEERPAGHGGGLRRHRDPEERRACTGATSPTTGTTSSARLAPIGSSTSSGRARRSSARSRRTRSG